MTTTTDTPRIYVASLSDYNSGTLHGAWIDIDSTMTGDDIHELVAEMLADSPENKLCQWCGASVTDHTGERASTHAPLPGKAEEWAIHDYDGFGGLDLGEYESFDRIAEIGAAIEEHGLDVVAAFVGNDSSADLASISDAYLGEWDSLADYVEDFHESCGTELGALEAYIDWEKVARDWEYNGDVWTATSSNYKVLIFSSNY